MANATIRKLRHPASQVIGGITDGVETGIPH
jgi:hypothetical protein